VVSQGDAKVPLCPIGQLSGSQSQSPVHSLRYGNAFDAPELCIRARSALEC